MSIKARLLIFSLCISLIPITAITMVYYLNARSTLKQKAFEELQAMEEARRLHILSFMGAEENRAESFSSDGFMRDTLERIVQGGPDAALAVEELNKHLRVNEKPLDKNLVEISVVSMDGVVVSSTNKEAIGRDVSRDPAFIKSKKMGTCVKQPFYYPQVGTECFGVFTPYNLQKVTQANRCPGQHCQSGGLERYYL